MSGRFIAVVGPSGVGKDSVMRALAASDTRIRLARRVITRPSAAGGEDFDGVSPADFDAREAAGAFALVWSAHGLRYGISASVDDLLADGHDVLANLSRTVLAEAQRRFVRARVIAIHADRAVLAARLAARGRECPDEIASRLARADQALPPGVDAATIDNSGPLDRTVAAVRSLLYPVRA